MASSVAPWVVSRVAGSLFLGSLGSLEFGLLGWFRWCHYFFQLVAWFSACLLTFSIACLTSAWFCFCFFFEYLVDFWVVFLLDACVFFWLLEISRYRLCAWLPNILCYSKIGFWDLWPARGRPAWSLGSLGRFCWVRWVRWSLGCWAGFAGATAQMFGKNREAVRKRIINKKIQRKENTTKASKVARPQ